MLCLVFCSQFVVASEKEKQLGSESDETASEQSILGENQPTESPSGNLAGRSRIGAIFGFRSGNAHRPTSAGYGTTVISGHDNLAVGFGYSHWLREDLTLNVSMSVLALPQIGKVRQLVQVG